jgi:serine/threonine protein kinase
MTDEPATPGSVTRTIDPQPSPRRGDTGLRLPDKLGPYRVLRRLGEGGMGVVYIGHDDVLDRPVALKVLPAGSRLDPEARAKLEVEARSLAQVVHPNVVSVYAQGEDKLVAYVAMELVDGPDLREVLEREGPLEPARALRWMRDAALGLAAAHRKGLVHRDVKPANLLLEKATGRVKVADFGIAARQCVDASMSGSSLVSGTPLYVAPEVIRDGSGDHRADMYSLGATFFHLLSGAPPYDGKTPAAALVGHTSEPVPDLAAVRAGVPRPAARLVARLMAKDPADRFATWDDAILATEAAAFPEPPELLEVEDAPPRVVVREELGQPTRRRKRRSHGWKILAACLVLFWVVPKLIRGTWHVHLPTSHSQPSTPDRPSPIDDLEREIEDNHHRAQDRGLACRSEAFSVILAASRASWKADLLDPHTVSEAGAMWRDRNPALPSPFETLPGTCSQSRTPFAVLGKPSADGMQWVAWHRHGKYVVLHSATQGETWIPVKKFEAALEAESDRQGLVWDAVEPRIRKFLEPEPENDESR